MYWYFCYCGTEIFGGEYKANFHPWKIIVTLHSGTNTPNVPKKINDQSYVLWLFVWSIKVKV